MANLATYNADFSLLTGKKIFLPQYLENILLEFNIQEIFVLQGDYVFKVVEHFARPGCPIRIIRTSSDIEAGFCAYGAALSAQRPAVVLVTYHVGAIPALSAFIGASQGIEKIPLILISGAPGIKELKFQKEEIYHHLSIDYLAQWKAFEVYCKNSVRITDLGIAAQKIRQVFQKSKEKSIPGYIEIPRDLVATPLPTIQNESWHFTHVNNKTHNNTQEIITAVFEKIKNSRSPVFIVGQDIQRYNLEPLFLELLSVSGIPFTTTMMAKGAISDYHAQSLGLYFGSAIDSKASQRVDTADLQIHLGVLPCDTNNALGIGNIVWGKKDNVIRITEEDVCVNSCHYRVDIEDFLKKLVYRFSQSNLKRKRKKFTLKLRKNKLTNNKPTDSEAKLTVDSLIRALNIFINQDSSFLYDIIADVGDPFIAGLKLIIPPWVRYFSQASYAFMGGAPGMAIGSQIVKPQRRPILIIGDMGLQGTVSFLDTIKRYQLTPIVIIFNNQRMGTLDNIKKIELNQVNCWDYGQILKLINVNEEQGAAYKVKTISELQTALEKSKEQNEKFILIDALLDENDKSETMKIIGRELGKKVQKACAK